jgi:hypothetical protein
MGQTLLLEHFGNKSLWSLKFSIGDIFPVVTLQGLPPGAVKVADALAAHESANVSQHEHLNISGKETIEIL